MHIVIGIIFILIVHWIADFIFQTHNMAINKSKSVYWLSVHVLAYTSISLILNGIFFGVQGYPMLEMFGVILLNGALHWVTDFFTSKQSSRLYAKGDYHNFFVIIGLDQLIHTITLIITYSYLLQQYGN